ncbi:unnamed protein product [Phaeothamnion confervicola]
MSPPNAALQVVIVDEHNDALPAIHRAIRRKILGHSFDMLHFDAHPDLNIPPGLPAGVCFKPRELYDALDESDSGIAAWILPLAFEGHLKRLWWIRPKAKFYEATGGVPQFTDGPHRISVGERRSNGCLGVNSTAPYYVDDRLFCPAQDFVATKELQLYVSECPSADGGGNGGSSSGSADSVRALAVTAAPAVHTVAKNDADVASVCDPATVATAASESTTAANPATAAATAVDAAGWRIGDGGGGGVDIDQQWVLDICLDFFSTENPFMEGLESLAGVDAARAFQEAFALPSFRGAGTALPHAQQIADETEFTRIFTALLDAADGAEGREGLEGEAAAAADSGTSLMPAATPDSDSGKGGSDGGDGQATSSGDGSAQRTATTAAQTELALGSPTTPGQDAETAHSRLGALAALYPPGVGAGVTARLTAALAAAGAEARDAVRYAEHCLCLPRHRSTCTEMAVAVDNMQNFLRGAAHLLGRPAVVIVAASAGDGYTPPDALDFLLPAVIGALRETYGAVEARIVDPAAAAGGDAGSSGSDGWTVPYVSGAPLPWDREADSDGGVERGTSRSIGRCGSCEQGGFRSFVEKVVPPSQE